jgi:uncharacterized protein YjbJ (UPF0337 family)
MNKDQVKGIIDDVAGSAKRKTGELTNDFELQAEGIVQQAKGKVEKAWGNAKEVVREANEEAGAPHNPHA